MGVERSLNFNACRIVAYRHAGGDYLIVCGSNRQCQLLNSEGIFLGCITECTKWIWCTDVKLNNTIVVSIFHCISFYGAVVISDDIVIRVGSFID